MRHHVLGIRHHGPGSAKHLDRVLRSMQPDIVLIEGPPEGTELLHMALSLDMVPPVALLVYQPAALQKASFYPFAAFSPEWLAIQFALEYEVPVRFIDLSVAHRWDKDSETEDAVRSGDPLSEIARQAGYQDGESWWEDVIEQNYSSENLFEGICELMGEVRKSHPEWEKDLHNLRREAFMRKGIRQSIKEGYENIAVVCGAYHAPALQHLPTASSDQKRLKGLKRTKTSATWIPWTYERLSYQSGYGAGVLSPAWYEMVHDISPEDLPTHWMTHAAHLFRSEDLDASPAHVIEAVRLAETLAQLRGKQVPRLEELREAVQTVFCGGETAPMALVEKKLIIGDKMGQVTDEAPAFPLQRDIQQQKKRLRLKNKTVDKPLDLDLRKPRDLEKSQFLHRLSMLDIPYGKFKEGRIRTSTFHEYWQLDWQPTCELKIIEAATFGNTLLEACQIRVKQALADQPHLPTLTQWMERVFLADLAAALPGMVAQMETQVALSADISHLMEALPPLVNVRRYGNVRQTDGELVAQVIHGLVPRVVVGLPDACAHLDQEHGEKLFELIQRVHKALQILDSEAYLTDWMGAISQLTEHSNVYRKIAGLAVRMLLDKGEIDPEVAASHMSLALSAASDPETSVVWLEGFLEGSGLLLIHNATLWRILDGWLGSLKGESFQEVLPLLRRTFAAFTPPERQQMGQLAKTGKQIQTAQGFTLDEVRIEQVVPLLERIFGN